MRQTQPEKPAMTGEDEDESEKPWILAPETTEAVIENDGDIKVLVPQIPPQEGVVANIEEDAFDGPAADLGENELNEAEVPAMPYAVQPDNQEAAKAETADFAPPEPEPVPAEPEAESAPDFSSAFEAPIIDTSLVETGSRMDEVIF